MTAINVIVQSEAVHILSDGSRTGLPGPLGYTAHAKVQMLPHLNAVVAVRGSALFAGILAACLPEAARSFDELREGVPKAARMILDEFGAVFSHAPAPIEFEAYVAGISEWKGPDAFVVMNRSRYGYLPWLPKSIEGFGFTPVNGAIQARLSQEFGGRHPDSIDPERDGLRIMEIQRADPEGGQFVGDFAQLTTVSPEGITSRILRRWNSPTMPFEPFERPFEDPSIRFKYALATGGVA